MSSAKRESGQHEYVYPLVVLPVCRMVFIVAIPYLTEEIGSSEPAVLLVRTSEHTNLASGLLDL